MRMTLAIGLLLTSTATPAEVARVEVAERKRWPDAASPYEMLRGTTFYELDPKSRAARDVTDIGLAPTNARGKVEYSGPFLVIRPVDAARRNGVTLLEPPNRGNDQTNRWLYEFSGFSVAKPGAASILRPGPLARGYTLAWVGWQGDLKPDQFGLSVPAGTGNGRVRFSFFDGPQATSRTTALKDAGGYCARSPDQRRAELRRIERFDDPGVVVPLTEWRFAREAKGRLVPDPCSVTMISAPSRTSNFVLTYDGEDASIMGLGEAAVRDFASHLKHRDVATALNEMPTRVVGFGYSQSARLLRDFLYRGFNRDARGRQVFDGLMIYAAGAGRGSFNHRYAVPGDAGNSVMSFLRPVDLYPFADVATPDLSGRRSEGLLDRARRGGGVPKTFTVFSSSEYWARAGSLMQTTTDGTRPVPLDKDNRLYHFVGTPHAPRRPARYRTAGSEADYPYNYSMDVGLSLPAMLEHMRAWIVDNREPPPSTAPQPGSTLVDAASLRVPAMRVPPAPPPVWQLDLGRDWRRKGVVAEPPKLGRRYPLLVPAVDADGNELSGVRGLVARVPLGTYTAWNYNLLENRSFGNLSGLQGSFVPFARTKAERNKAGDPRPSIEERYGDKAGWLRTVDAAILSAERDGWLLPEDRAFNRKYMEDSWQAAEDVWNGVVPPPLAPRP